MSFIIHYRDPRFAGFIGISIVPGEVQARAALERLQRGGYEVTNTEPRLARATAERRAALV